MFVGNEGLKIVRGMASVSPLLCTSFRGMLHFCSIGVQLVVTCIDEVLCHAVQQRMLTCIGFLTYIFVFLSGLGSQSYEITTHTSHDVIVFMSMSIKRLEFLCCLFCLELYDMNFSRLGCLSLNIIVFDKKDWFCLNRSILSIQDYILLPFVGDFIVLLCSFFT